ncbi:hypothetical protein G6045_01785 [Streptomyces sp. YC504]|uniref:Uncharacterized protein n=1 Tax=Streptomyces mesophilus TaxID=1775132 RepID=A0A6G4XA49_9ACTN|nr:hypothetical protein [Streptomyces mesophilus]NGO74419.1 hypothetical protein [Streptomyces mesophilus]
MPKDNSVARHRQARLFADCVGIGFAEALRRLDDARTAARDHRHGSPNMAFLTREPYSGGHTVDTDLAARVVGAAGDRCRHCQIMWSVEALDHRPTVAALAGSVFGFLPKAGRVRDSTVRWAVLARRARADRGDSAAASAVWEAVEAMEVPQVYGLLEDGLRVRTIKWPVVVHHSDFGDAWDGEPRYQVTVASAEDGSPQVPALGLGHEAGRAGLAHLREVGLPNSDGDREPVMDPRWEVRVSLGARALKAIVRVDDEGRDDLVLWEAAKPVPLTARWWDLLDRTQHVVVFGPYAVGAPEAPERVAVVARVKFW